MKFLNTSFLKNLFSSAYHRDVMLGELFQSLKCEGPSLNTRNKILLLAQKYPNDQGIEHCLSHAINYVDAFYGSRAAYFIAQDLTTGKGAYNRVRNMATKKTQALVFGMSLEPPIRSHKIDVAAASDHVVSICEQFMTGKIKDSILHDQNTRVEPLNSGAFFDRLQF